MIRGVSFIINRKVPNLLKVILECTESKNYYWFNIQSQDEVWNETQDNVFFEQDNYDSKSFHSLIQKKHFIVFVKLQGYCDNNTFSNIHTFEEFWNSSCQLLLLIYDCKNVDIYIKDQSLIQKIYDCAIAYEFEEICFITDNTDSRTKMDVL